MGCANFSVFVSSVFSESNGVNLRPQDDFRPAPKRVNERVRMQFLQDFARFDDIFPMTVSGGYDERQIKELAERVRNYVRQNPGVYYVGSGVTKGLQTVLDDNFAQQDQYWLAHA